MNRMKDPDEADSHNDISLSSGRKCSGLAPSPTSLTQATAEPNTSAVERHLASINDLLEARLRNDAQLRRETDKNQQMMNEWIIAAAAIDCICFWVFGFTLVAGSLIFSLLFLSRN